MTRALRLAGTFLLWTAIALCLAATVVPHFLDRIYYRGPATAHFDGAHFFNPDSNDDTLNLPAGRRNRLVMEALFGDPKRPAWPDRVTVRRSKPPARVAGGAMLATWVGHATMLVQADGLNILTDPVWSPRASAGRGEPRQRQCDRAGGGAVAGARLGSAGRGAARNRGRRDAQPSLGQPLVRRPQPRALVELRGAGGAPQVLLCRG